MRDKLHNSPIVIRNRMKAPNHLTAWIILNECDLSRKLSLELLRPFHALNNNLIDAAKNVWIIL
jgi:hypothetical protein